VNIAAIGNVLPSVPLISLLSFAVGIWYGITVEKNQQLLKILRRVLVLTEVGPLHISLGGHG
jgi:hypothetical protein